MANTLSITNVANVTLTQALSGLATPNINSIALFTTEQPSNINPFGTYFTSAAVAADFGSSSTTYAMATNIFAQSPNILSGGGQLVVIPLQGSVSATQGKIVTPNVLANLTNFKTVSNGNLKVTLNGTVINLTSGLNFTNCQSLNDVATIIQTQLPDIIVSASANALTFISKKVGAVSVVALGSVTGGAGTDISGSTFLNASAATSTVGVNSSGETIAAAISRLNGQVSYYGAMTNLEMEDAVLTALAATVQSMDLIFFHHFSSTTDIAGVCTTITSASDTNFRSVLYTVSPTAANLVKAAYMGRAFAVDFTGSNTAITMNAKALANVAPDYNLTQTIKNACITAGVDLFASVAGLPFVFSNGGDNYFDNVYNNLALKLNVQTAAFNFLYTSTTKIPQTETGMDGYKSAIRQVMNQFVANRVIGTGLSWNSADTFGDPADFIRNISDFGYFIYSQPIALQAQATRAQRIAPTVQIAFKLAGAIHSSIINITAQQ